MEKINNLPSLQSGPDGPDVAYRKKYDVPTADDDEVSRSGFIYSNFWTHYSDCLLYCNSCETVK